MATYFDNFEGYNTPDDFLYANAFYISGETLTFLDGQGEFGNRAVQGRIDIMSARSGTQGKVGINFKTPATLVTCELLRAFSGSDSNFRLNIDSKGRFVVYYASTVSSTGNYTYTSKPFFVPDKWYTVEIGYYQNQSGYLDIYIDGKLVLNIGRDFYQTTSTMYLMYTHAGYIWDAFYLTTGTWSSLPTYGRFRGISLSPNANTAQADWTGDYTNLVIDDTLNGTPAFTSVDTTTIGAKSEFETEDVPVSVKDAFMHKSIVETQRSAANAKEVRVTTNIGASQHTDDILPFVDHTQKNITAATVQSHTSAEINASKISIEVLP